MEGERFVVTLPPEEAYGERDKALQQRVPAETFGGVDQIEPGMCFLAHSEDGRRVENVMVTEVDEENGFVVVDTNHPLAGMTLEFEVCVWSCAIRDPIVPGMATGLRGCRASWLVRASGTACTAERQGKELGQRRRN